MADESAPETVGLRGMSKHDAVLLPLPLACRRSPSRRLCEGLSILSIFDAFSTSPQPQTPHQGSPVDLRKYHQVNGLDPGRHVFGWICFWRKTQLEMSKDVQGMIFKHHVGDDRVWNTLGLPLCHSTFCRHSKVFLFFFVSSNYFLKNKFRRAAFRRALTKIISHFSICSTIQFWIYVGYSTVFVFFQRNSIKYLKNI